MANKHMLDTFEEPSGQNKRTTWLRLQGVSSFSTTLSKPKREATLFGSQLVIKFKRSRQLCTGSREGRDAS
jgi:hypothetical protein